MPHDALAQELYAEICRIPLIDPHSHIDPHRPVARSLDDILGYHYYTELAHSAGMSQALLAKEVPPRERVRAILGHMDRFDNTAQYGWFLEIARTFLGFEGDRVTAADCDWLCDVAERVFAQPDWEEQVFRRTNLESIFLTNEFDDPLTGFDTKRYVPCLRTDALVFDIHKKPIRERVAKVTGVEVGDKPTLVKALIALFERFTAAGARACAISLPPDFRPQRSFDTHISELSFEERDHESPQAAAVRQQVVFMYVADCCSKFKLPFDLMIGVNRRVYENGVYQGQDLFDQRTSLIQYGKLFNEYRDVTFCVSVLSSGQNQELASYSWIFPNVVTSGHWWYSNIPVHIEHDLRARLQAVPKTKQLGYYSDAYKLEFVLPKFNMYRRILANVLADDFVRPGVYSAERALDFARLLLRENVRSIFRV